MTKAQAQTDPVTQCFDALDRIIDRLAEQQPAGDIGYRMVELQHQTGQFQ
jgi:hypothetical protein